MCFYNENDNPLNRIHKFRNIREHIFENIGKVCYPGRNLSIYEMLLLWRGSQCIRNKAGKYDIKLYEWYVWQITMF